MNFRFKQSLKMLAVAGAISGLVACGGGSDGPATVTVTKDLAPIAVKANDPAAIAAFKATTSALIGKSITFGDLVFDETTAAVSPKLPSNTSMTFTPVPATGVPAGVTPLSGFKIENDLYIVEGYIVAGSAVYVPTNKTLKVSIDDPALQSADFAVGATYTFVDFAVDFDTADRPVGQAVNVPVKITIGNREITVNVPAQVGAGGALTVGGQPIATLGTVQIVPTGSAS